MASLRYDKAVVLEYYREHGITLIPEVQFSPDRKWTFDFVVADTLDGDEFAVTKVAIEVDGGAFSGGRHTRGAGFVEDLCKLNSALALGWRTLRCIPQDVCMDDFREIVEKVIEVSRNEK